MGFTQIWDSKKASIKCFIMQSGDASRNLSDWKQLLNFDELLEHPIRLESSCTRSWEVPVRCPQKSGSVTGRAHRSPYEATAGLWGAVDGVNGELPLAPGRLQTP